MTAPGRKLVAGGVLLLLGGFALLPVAWMAYASVLPYADLYASPPRFTMALSMDYYRRVLGSTPFLTFLRNSAVVAIASTLISTAFACMAAYALNRHRARALVLRAVLLAYIFPQILLVLPLFTALSAMGLMKNQAGLVLAYVTFTFPFSTWLLVAYFGEIPHEIQEAARIDGASNFDIFWRLMLPLAAPGVATAAIFGFINSWNEFLYALIILGGGEGRTLPVGLYNFVGGEFAQWGELMAATTMTMAPTLLLFLLVQRRIAGGLVSGAVRG